MGQQYQGGVASRGRRGEAKVVEAGSVGRTAVPSTNLAPICRGVGPAGVGTSVSIDRRFLSQPHHLRRLPAPLRQAESAQADAGAVPVAPVTKLPRLGCGWASLVTCSGAGATT